MILEDVAKNRKSMLKESINIVVLDYLKKLVNKDKTSIQIETKNQVEQLEESAKKYYNFIKPFQDLILTKMKMEQNKKDIETHQKKLKDEGKEENEELNNAHSQLSNDASSVQAFLDKKAKELFVETSLFEHAVNIFIEQVPIQSFELKSPNETIGSFSYNTGDKETLELLADKSGITMSDTAIKFNMTYNKAVALVKQQGGQVQKSKGNIGELLNFKNNFNLYEVEAHHEKLQHFNEILDTRRILTTQDQITIIQEEIEQIKLNNNDLSALDNLNNLWKSLQYIIEGKSTTKKRVKARFLKEMVNINKYLLDPIYIDTEDTSYYIENKNIEKIYEKLSLIYDKIKPFIKEGVAQYNIAENKNNIKYITINKGQLKEAFFGHFYNLENTNGEKTKLFHYIANMDTARARLWGDYNIKYKGQQYAISVKSEGANMDIKQFVQLAKYIIDWCKIFRQKHINLSKRQLKRLILQIQRRDIKAGHFQFNFTQEDANIINAEEVLTEIAQKKILNT